MTARVLIIGGYGNFGSFISRRLSAEPGLQVIIAGRSVDKAQSLVEDIENAADKKPPNRPEAARLNIDRDLDAALKAIRPDIVIHTSGPFQGQGYRVARACIRVGAHYIDLADGREFVAGINALDGDARDAGVCVVAGASSVPGLSSAVIEHFKDRFDRLRRLDYGISTAQQTSRGTATTRAVLGYAGKKFKTLIDDKKQTLYGWQGLRRHDYPVLGKRFLSDCDIPDLSIFPDRYPQLETIRFGAGTQIGWMHLGLWGLSWLVRAGCVKSLAPMAPLLLRVSGWFDRLGKGQSAFHMTMSGTDANRQDMSLTWYLVARDNHGPYIPCVPAIILACRLAAGGGPEPGAQPCVGLISLDDYMDALDGLHVDTILKPST